MPRVASAALYTNAGRQVQDADGSWRNDAEVEYIVHLVQQLSINSFNGKLKDRVGIITSHQGQIDALRRQSLHIKLKVRYDEVEIAT
eukprot:21043-Heterococcus_DN1.PRE.1